MDRVGNKSKPFVDENVLGNRLGNRIREGHLLGSQYLEGIYKVAVHMSQWRDLFWRVVLLLKIGRLTRCGHLLVLFLPEIESFEACKFLAGEDKSAAQCSLE